MRTKIIRGFLGVYLAVCVTYGAVRSLTVAAAAKETEAGENPFPQTTAEIVSAPEPELIMEQETTATETSPYVANAGHSKGKHGGRGGNSMPSVNEQTSAPTAAAEAESKDEDKEKSSGDDASEAPAAPTLEDYLKNLRCGGCGRNCPLLNPHCMRGARKEAQAESAYYQQYSAAYSDGV